jgi:hypothetical protein
MDLVHSRIHSKMYCIVQWLNDVDIVPSRVGRTEDIASQQIAAINNDVGSARITARNHTHKHIKNAEAEVRRCERSER